MATAIIVSLSPYGGDSMHDNLYSLYRVLLEQKQH